jgi:hypothetical protein
MHGLSRRRMDKGTSIDEQMENVGDCWKSEVIIDRAKVCEGVILNENGDILAKSTVRTMPSSKSLSNIASSSPRLSFTRLNI